MGWHGQSYECGWHTENRQGVYKDFQGLTDTVYEVRQSSPKSGYDLCKNSEYCEINRDTCLFQKGHITDLRSSEFEDILNYNNKI